MIGLNEYQDLAHRTKSEGTDMVNVALGLAGEAGEVTDIIKKVVFHGHELDVQKLVAELGDILWYVAIGASVLGFSLSDVASRNISKLKSRYPDGFSSESSINREG